MRWVQSVVIMVLRLLMVSTCSVFLDSSFSVGHPSLSRKAEDYQHTFIEAAIPHSVPGLGAAIAKGRYS